MSKHKSKITGLSKVLNNLNVQIKGIEGKTLKGLIRAGIIVRRAMEKQSPTIPRDTSNLSHSFFLVTSKGEDHTASADPQAGSFIGKDANKLTQGYSVAKGAMAASVGISSDPAIGFGFSAYYALYVHEIDKNYQRPGSGWKFLEKALDNNHDEILKMIKSEVRI